MIFSGRSCRVSELEVGDVFVSDLKFVEYTYTDNEWLINRSILSSIDLNSDGPVGDLSIATVVYIDRWIHPLIEIETIEFGSVRGNASQLVWVMSDVV